MNNQTNGYQKRPWWMWLAMYLVIGILIYAVVYLVWMRRSGATSYSAPSTTESNTVSTDQNAVSGNNQNTSMVKVTANGFEPQTITVKAGGQVTWTNQSGDSVSIDSDPHPQHTLYPPLNLGIVKDGDTISLVFDKAGTYKYHNHFNPSQTGTVVVQ